ncbi:hematopoietic death receptor isoform X2 [Chanos chanos]|uniref:Hematopoietic death receptor isoform X2 n=1 Tax=Chanos chanos TaxID=29144 RepID=A0A6J2WSY8_CHACN|nr:tumor necrosis factor receptor superfamily member 10A-like isoform X2 [Chanos chanos]
MKEDFSMKFMNFMVVVLIWALNVSAAPGTGLSPTWIQGVKVNRTVRDITCRENLEYPHSGHCCKNCPAGTYVKTPCDKPSEKGQCEPCEFDTFTEHSSGLPKCLSCSKCRPDQETVAKCTSTQNTQCQCKEGYYCLPNQACEVCKKCNKCKDDEELVERCTRSSNTICRKRGGSPDSSNAGTITVIFVVLGCVAIVALIFLARKWFISRKSTVTSLNCVKICVGEDNSTTTEESQNKRNSELDSFVPFLQTNQLVGTQPTTSCEEDEDDEDRGLGESLPNTTSSSQTSLRAQPSAPLPGPSPLLSPELLRQTQALECEKPKRLSPLNGDESLKKSFDLFSEMDVHCHNRFFRYIGLSDNNIKNVEMLSPDDKVYELLKIWMEKEGMKADFNDLIEALLHLDQRLSAENIIAKAIGNGYYKYEDD